MQTRRRGHDERDQDESEERRAEPPTQPDASDRLLELQRTAGNRAVSAMLARAPGDDKAKDKDGPAAASGYVAKLPDIGLIALLSFSFPGGSGPKGGSGRGADPPQPGEVVLTSRVGAHSPELMNAATSGRAMDVEVTMTRDGKSFQVKLTGAIVSSYSQSGQGPDAVESWSLNFRSLTRTESGAAAGGDGR